MTDRNDRSSDSDIDGENGTHGIHRRQIEPDPDDPYHSLVHVIAEIEGCAVDELPPFYEYVDDLVEDLFGNPPPDKAQVQLEFTYYNYRIHLDQRGNLTLMKQAEPLDVDG